MTRARFARMRALIKAPERLGGRGDGEIARAQTRQHLMAMTPGPQSHQLVMRPYWKSQIRERLEESVEPCPPYSGSAQRPRYRILTLLPCSVRA